MCGIVGMVGKGPVNQSLYDALLVLQHRGQDAAGIVTCEGEKLRLRKNNGLVRDVFRTSHMIQLRGRVGVGHGIDLQLRNVDPASSTTCWNVQQPHEFAELEDGVFVAGDNQLAGAFPLSDAQ